MTPLPPAVRAARLRRLEHHRAIADAKGYTPLRDLLDEVIASFLDTSPDAQAKRRAAHEKVRYALAMIDAVYADVEDTLP